MGGSALEVKPITDLTGRYKWRIVIVAILNLVLSILFDYNSRAKDNPPVSQNNTKFLIDSLTGSVVLVFGTIILFAISVALILSILPWIQDRPTFFMKKIIVSYFWISVITGTFFAILIILDPVMERLQIPH